MNYVYEESKGLITAIVPRYTDYGNVNYVYYENGTFEISENRLRYIMNRYLQLWGCSIETKTSKLIRNDSAGALPIAVTLNHTLIPLKVRKPGISGDGIYGYFCHEAISYPEEISRNPAETLICNDIEFEVSCTFENIRKKRLFAEQIQANWQRLNGYKNEEMLLRNQAYETLYALHLIGDHILKYPVGKEQEN